MTFRAIGWVVVFASLIAAPVAWAAPATAKISAELNYKSLPAGQQAVVALVAEVPAGFHAQSHTPLDPNLIPFDVKLESTDQADVSPPIYPVGEVHDYEQLGKLSVYTGRVIIYVPVKIKPGVTPGPLKLSGSARYQMCDDKACFAPQSPKFEVSAEIVAAGAAPVPNAPELFADYKPTAATTAPAPATAPSASIAPAPASAGGSDWNIWTAFGAALLAGLLFNVMPCVLPVLPLKAAAFHRAGEHRRSRSIALGAAFSVGIIGVFAILAILVLVLRVISWGSLFSNPIFVWGLVILLLICAFGMFGLFTFQLPTALYMVDPRQDTIGGNILFGAFTAILATPCTAPLLPPLLIWASAQPAYVGVPAMLMVGVGMALPYLILSATPELAKRFPRTGPWSELFKQMMGFMLLAAAAYFGAGRIIHGADFWWVIVAVIAIASLYLMARTVQLTKNAGPVVVSAILAVLMLGGSLWWTAKITGLASGGSAGALAEWHAYSDATFEQARASGKPVLVKFTANWCASCQFIEGSVFRDPQVWQALKSHEVTAIKVDLTDEDAPGKSLLLKLNPAGGIPLTAIFTPGHDQPLVLASVYTSGELLKALESVTTTAQASAK